MMLEAMNAPTVSAMRNSLAPVSSRSSTPPRGGGCKEGAAVIAMCAPRCRGEDRGDNRDGGAAIDVGGRILLLPPLLAFDFGGCWLLLLLPLFWREKDGGEGVLFELRMSYTWLYMLKNPVTKEGALLLGW